MAESANDSVGGKNPLSAGRVPPHNAQAEEAVLSTCLNSENARGVVLAILDDDSFYVPAHRLIFSAIYSLSMKQAPIDMITVSDYLNRNGDLNTVGGTSYLSHLSDLSVLQSNASEYASIVRQNAILRRLIFELDQVIKLSYEKEQEANNLVDLAIKRLSDMRQNPTGGGFEKVYDILTKTVQEIVDIKNNKKERNVVKTGFASLDRALGGLRPGTLTVVAARPGMGKSAFVINIATNVSTAFQKTPVAFFSLEMSKKEITNRILSSMTNVSTRKLQEATVTEDELFGDIATAITVLIGAPFYIDDRSGINTIEMMAKCRELKNKNQLGLIIIDYLQLMSGTGGRSQSNRQQEISDISRMLKVMAKELDVPVIALSQLSRAAERVEGTDTEPRKPLLSDLRDSGAIEQDADAVIFIYRKKYYSQNENKKDKEDADIIIAKNRQGETKTVKLKWWAERTLFYEEELVNREPPPPEFSKKQVDPYDVEVTISTDISAFGASSKDYPKSNIPEDIPVEYFQSSGDPLVNTDIAPMMEEEIPANIPPPFEEA